MALVRILVDGYSLLHEWDTLAPSYARHTSQAREALVARLTQYRDAVGTPITVFFDGQGAPANAPKLPSTPELEILFSRHGQTADDMIERTAVRMRPYGEVLVVTNDIAERETVRGFGGMTASCRSFILQVEDALGELATDLKLFNRRERDGFRR